MIEQLAITTTPRYIFPQRSIHVSLPQRFTELSIHSLRHAQNLSLQLNQRFFQQNSNSEQQMQTVRIEFQPIILKPRLEETTVAAVDTSSMKIGETSRGMLVAVRGAYVWRKKKHYRYLRIGPFIFHVTEENKKGVYNALQRAYALSQREHIHSGSPVLSQMPMRMASLLERWLQTKLSRTVTNGLILFDGSLTSGVGEASMQRMKRILENARKRGNVVLAISKSTSLRFNRYLITDVLFRSKPPYLSKILGLKPEPPIVLMGDVYLAKLTRGNYAFRLDIDKEVSIQQRIEAVEKLLGNDLILQSYPETLRLAHILCTFTANEVIAMQHFIARKYRLRIVERPDMHRLLFGPFGKGERRS